MTTTNPAETAREKWERIAKSLPAGEADGIEENAEDLGLEVDSPEFFAECIGQAIS